MLKGLSIFIRDKIPKYCIQEGVFWVTSEPEPALAEDTPPCLSWIQRDKYLFD